MQQAAGVQRDWIDHAATWSTVAAALFALYAVVQAGRSNRQALKAFQLERRVDFELERLLKIRELLATGNRHTHGWQSTIAMNLRLLRDGDLPLTRETFTVRHDQPHPLATALGVALEPSHMWVESAAPDGRILQHHLADEVDAAIRTRVDERGNRTS